MKRIVPRTFLFLLLLGFISRAEAQVVSYTGGLYSQNFDSMGAAGTVTPLGWHVGSGLGGAVPGTTVVADDGSNTVAGNYNYGVAGVHLSDERALGSKNDSGTQLDTEVHFVNNTGFSITQFTVNYTGEQWRDGGSGVPNTLRLQVSLNGVSWINLGAAFNFTSPINNAGLPTLLDGNAVANQVTGIGGTFTLSTAIANGAAFYLRFADKDDSGKDAGISVDDFKFTAVPEPSGYMLLGIGLLLCSQRFRRHSARRT